MSPRVMIAVSSLMLALYSFSSIVEAQTPPPETQQSATEWARRIAFTISQNPGAATPDSAIMSLAYAISRNNVVEIKYVVKDPMAFTRLKQNAEKLRLGKTSFYCNASRISYLTMGLVFHDITTSPSGEDQLEIDVDRSSCDSLPKITRLNPGSLAQLALNVANAENEASAKNYPPNGVLQFNGASAHEGVVEERLTFLTAVPTSQQITNMTNVTRGFMCANYGTPLLQGITLHQTYISKDGHPIFDFAINGSHC